MKKKHVCVYKKLFNQDLSNINNGRIKLLVAMFIHNEIIRNKRRKRKIIKENNKNIINYKEKSITKKGKFVAKDNFSIKDKINKIKKEKNVVDDDDLKILFECSITKNGITIIDNKKMKRLRKRKRRKEKRQKDRLRIPL